MATHRHSKILSHIIGSLEELSPFDKAVTIIGSIEPLSQIPQVLLVYKLQSAKELSLFSWGFGVFATFLWLIYSIRKKSPPLIISSALWLAADIPVVVAILLFN